MPEEQRQSIFSKDTLIPLSLVLTLVGAIFISATMYVRIGVLEDRLSTFESVPTDVAALKTDVAWIRSVLTKQSVVVK